MLCPDQAEFVKLPHDLGLESDSADGTAFFIRLNMKETEKGPEADALLHRTFNLFRKSRDVISLPCKYMDGFCVQTYGGPRRIHGNIPAANHGNSFSGKIHGISCGNSLKEIRGRDDIPGISVFNRKPCSNLRAKAKIDGIVILQQPGK